MPTFSRRTFFYLSIDHRPADPAMRLNSVRIAIIDDRLGFQNAPCAASLQNVQDCQLSRITRGEGESTGDWRE